MIENVLLNLFVVSAASSVLCSMALKPHEEECGETIVNDVKVFGLLASLAATMVSGLIYFAF